MVNSEGQHQESLILFSDKVIRDRKHRDLIRVFGRPSMAIQRRDLLLSALPVSASLLLQASAGVSKGEEDLANAPFDQDTYRFWTSEVHEPSQAFQQHGKIVSQRGASVPNEAEFLFYSSETGFVRAASTEGDTPVSRKLME